MMLRKMHESAFSLWRFKIYNQTARTIKAFKEEIIPQEHSRHEDFKAAVKYQNYSRVERLVNLKRQANTLLAWRTVHKWRMT